MGDSRDALFRWLRSEDALGAPAWQVELLAGWVFGREPRVGTFRAMRAALDTLEPVADLENVACD